MQIDFYRTPAPRNQKKLHEQQSIIQSRENLPVKIIRSAISEKFMIFTQEYGAPFSSGLPNTHKKKGRQILPGNLGWWGSFYVL